MLKANNVPIGNSNIANLSGKENHDAKHDSSTHEAAWKGAGSKEGIEQWRIFNFAVHRLPENQNGTFYSGDSYIVLNSYKVGSSMALKYDLFFWLGEKTSQDEAGTAAYKTVELDDFLNGAAIQHREVQGYESETFLKVFGGHIKILEGGVDSGFQHVKPEDYQPRLLHFRGKRLVRVTQVPLAVSSMNEGDVFVLDAGLQIFTWFGSSASVFDKRKANEVVEDLKDERLGKPKSFIVVGYEECDDFWKLLGGKGKAMPAIPDNDTVAPQYNISLLCLSEESGNLKFNEVGNVAPSKKLARSLLNSDDVFILDAGVEVYVWVGKHSTAQEKKEAIPTAVKYLAAHNKPASTPIKRLVEGGEVDAFNHLFQ